MVLRRQKVDKKTIKNTAPAQSCYWWWGTCTTVGKERYMTGAEARACNGSLRAVPQSRGRAPGRGSDSGAKFCEAESFWGPLADIMRFTNLLYLAFYGHQKAMAISKVFNFSCYFKAGQRTDSRSIIFLLYFGVCQPRALRTRDRPNN